MFFQPLHQDRQLNDAYWSDVTCYLNAHGIQRLYIQWTRHDNSSFQQHDFWLLRRLQKLDPHFDLIIGLHATSDYFNFINQTADPRYFAAFVRANKTWLNEFRQLNKRFNINVAGYYFPGELNDAALADEAFLQFVVNTLHDWQNQLHKPLYISTFYTGSVSVARYHQQLLALQQAGVFVLHQDGLGVRHTPAEDAYKAIAALPPNVATIKELFTLNKKGFEPLPEPQLTTRLTRSVNSDAFFSLRYLPANVCQ